MPNKYWIPDFKKLYPEASEEVIALLRQTERKMQYQEYDRKINNVRTGQDGQVIGYIQSREESLEHLLESGYQFPDEKESIEETVIKKSMVGRLHTALGELKEDEYELIMGLYFSDKTEREMADILGISQKGINKRRHRILEKLKSFLENF